MQFWTLVIGRLYMAKFKTLKRRGIPFGLKTQVGPRCKHSPTLLFRPIINSSKGQIRRYLIRSTPKDSNVCMNVTSWCFRETIFDAEEQ